MYVTSKFLQILKCINIGWWKFLVRFSYFVSLTDTVIPSSLALWWRCFFVELFICTMSSSLIYWSKLMSEAIFFSSSVSCRDIEAYIRVKKNNYPLKNRIFFGPNNFRDFFWRKDKGYDILIFYHFSCENEFRYIVLFVINISLKCAFLYTHCVIIVKLINIVCHYFYSKYFVISFEFCIV